MKKTRILALILALLLVFSLTACGEKKESRKPIEIMKASFDKQMETKSAHSVMRANVTFDVPETLVTPDQKMIMDALKDASVELEAIIDTEAGKGHMRGELKAAGGMNFSGEAFILSENEMVLSTPLFPQQIVMNLNDLKELAAKQGQQFPDFTFTNAMKMQEEMKPMMETAFKFVGDIIKDEKPAIATQEVEFSTGKEKVTTVTFSYKADEALPAMMRMVENAINSEHFVTYIEQTAEMNKKMGLETASMNTEALKAQLKEAKEQFAQNKEQLEKMLGAYIKFNSMEFSFGVDKDDFMRASTFKMDLEIINPMDPSNTIPVKLDFSSTNDKINAVKAEEIPTTNVEPANSIKLQDLLMSMN